MARCKECIHYAVCGKQRFMVQIDVHSFGEYNQVDGVEKYCYEYESPTTHVAPRAEVERQKVEIEALKIANEKMYSAIEETKAEVAREIFEEIEKIGVVTQVTRNGKIIYDVSAEYAALKNKYTEGEDN